MNQAPRVRPRERPTHAQVHRDHRLPREPLLNHRALEITALHELHYEIMVSTVLAMRIQNTDNTVAVEIHHPARTAEKTLATHLITSELGVQHFNGDVSTALAIVRLPNNREATSTN